MARPRTWTYEGSFRRIGFLVDSASRDAERSVAVFEPPVEDNPKTRRAGVANWSGELQDTGRSPTRHTVDALLVRTSAELALDEGTEAGQLQVRPSMLALIARKVALIEALDEPGAGELVHPTLGPVQARCLTYSVGINRKSPDQFVFTMEFIVEPNRTPELALWQRFENNSLPSTADADRVATAATDAAAADVEENLVTEGPESVRDASAAAVEGVSAYTKALDVFSGAVDAAAALGAELQQIIAEASALATAPAALAARLVSVVTSVQAAARNAIASLAAYEAMADLVAATVTGLFPSIDDDANGNVRRIVNLFRVASLGEAVRVAAEMPFATMQDALGARDRLTALVDKLQEEDVDPAVYHALCEMRATIVRMLPPDDANLPALVEFTPRETIPSLVIAWRLYQDIAREQEIVERNMIANPLAVRGGVALSVLDG